MTEKATGGKAMQHGESTFNGLGGLKLYYQWWLPETTPKAVLLLVHGYAEHSGRYTHLAEHFTRLGYAIYACDLRGHGRSEGPQAYINRFFDYIHDLRAFLNLVKEREPGRKIFLLGHSMGAVVASLFAVECQSELAGLLLSGAGILIGGNVNPLMVRLSALIAALFPKLGVTKIDSALISRDPDVVARYDSDPLVYRGKVHARTGYEMLKAGQQVLQNAHRITLPILIMHGTADKLADPEGSKLLYEKVGSSDKTLKLYEGFYHEVFNDPEKERVFADMAAWLDKRA